jgi:hypothetical protein
LTTERRFAVIVAKEEAFNSVDSVFEGWELNGFAFGNPLDGNSNDKYCQKKLFCLRFCMQYCLSLLKSGVCRASHRK